LPDRPPTHSDGSDIPLHHYRRSQCGRPGPLDTGGRARAAGARHVKPGSLTATRWREGSCRLAAPPSMTISSWSPAPGTISA